VKPGTIDLPLLVEKMSCAPARVFRLPGGTLRRGAPADVTAFDPSAEWRVDPTRFRSKGRNSPYAGETLTGQVRLALVGGRVIHRSEG
jgi:dihydroorotase